MAQVCQSPFRHHFEHSDTYAYNLIWTGNHGCYSSIWSANLVEHAPGHFITYFALGNAFNLGRFRIEADFMNRSVERQTWLFRDCSLIGEVSYMPSSHLNIFAKAIYDVNSTEREGDLCVLPGTEITRIGAGMEYFPLNNSDVRVHAYVCHSFGSNGNPDGTVVGDQTNAAVGATWRMDFRKLKGLFHKKDTE